MLLFEVILADPTAAKRLLSPEILESTGAQIMTPKEAEFVGLEGIPDDPEGRPRVLIACRPADKKLISSRLEKNEEIAGFKIHEMG